MPEAVEKAGVRENTIVIFTTTTASSSSGRGTGQVGAPSVARGRRIGAGDRPAFSRCVIDGNVTRAAV
jgi:hypothetical protein